ncbi:MAG: class 1 fructose-bisphosphatase [Sphingomonadales bacterium]|nr:class 1 fructose-bisphosphatase [Sphingomonadales bacterium]MBD3772402.1 class 1 fructose-bisphosphatase [Paracoccaceae bacterium]
MILEAALSRLAERGKLESDVAAVISRLALAAVSVRGIINDGALGNAFGGKRSTRNAGGDEQHSLDIHADELFMSAMHKSPVRYYATEELERPVRLQPDKQLALAIDPLDGSSNIDTNVSIGTIFSILPAVDDDSDTEASFKQPGTAQLAAGFFIYGPQLALALTWGEGLHTFIYSARKDAFVKVHEGLTISRKAHEFAINASNARHWDEAVRAYVDDCLAGSSGPREKDYNMRWIASLVADCYRILMRGGVFLYPGDSRAGYGRGRLRLVYEANPIAMIIEQAGGSAIDGENRILDLVPSELHQRTPLIFGSADEVERIGRYFADPGAIGERAPLFGTRGLFRV